MRKIEEKEIIRLRLLADFAGSYFNERDEFIAHEYSNTYFIFSNCETLEDVNCKVIEWFSRQASKGIPYSQEWRNVKFRKFMLDGINQFLHTNFTQDEMIDIYSYLGNSCNHESTLDFVRSGYDMNIIKELGGCSKCDYICDTPLGSYCILTNESVKTTDCHYDEQQAIDKEHELLIRDMR